MYEDPNQDREDPPFPTQSGPPRFQSPQPARSHDEASPQIQRGNGSAAVYAKAPEYLQPQPRGPEPIPNDGLSFRLRMLSVGFQLGALSVAELWAGQLFMFRQEYQQRTGQAITDREAFEIITTPLVMSFSD